MLSICIPIYNFDVRALIEGLSSQIEQLSVPAEIILIDDCSDTFHKDVNKTICNKHNYYELESNVGRAKIRNLFLNYVKYEYLLFLDCDATLISDSFLHNYITTIQKDKPLIACGGRIYPSKCPSRNQLLSWTYGRKRESKTAKERSLHPNHSFATNNFIIKKSVLSKTRFDESLSKYGHEDTLIGYQLHTKGINIHHLENVVLNGDIESNKRFIYKTEEGLMNLASIQSKMPLDSHFHQSVHLLSFYKKIEDKALSPLISFLFFILKPIIYAFLTNGFINLKVFDFYKLGIFIKAMQKLK